MKHDGTFDNTVGAFVATPSALVRNEVVGACTESSLTASPPLQGLVTHLAGDAFADVDESVLVQEFAEVHPTWPETHLLSQDLREAHGLTQQSRHDPLVNHDGTFDDPVGVFVATLSDLVRNEAVGACTEYSLTASPRCRAS